MAELDEYRAAMDAALEELGAADVPRIDMQEIHDAYMAPVAPVIEAKRERWTRVWTEAFRLADEA